MLTELFQVTYKPLLLLHSELSQVSFEPVLTLCSDFSCFLKLARLEDVVTLQDSWHVARCLARWQDV